MPVSTVSSGLWVWVGIGGSIGSLCRYGVARWAGDRFKGVFPWGTLMVNAVGAFLLGVLQESSAAPLWMLFCGTGILGGLTTFSTWMMETFRLLEEGEYASAFLNVFCSLGVGMVLFTLGYCLGGGYR